MLKEGRKNKETELKKARKRESKKSVKATT
jgi:hypothetical protein